MCVFCQTRCDSPAKGTECAFTISASEIKIKICKKEKNRPECHPVEHPPRNSTLPFWSRCLSPPLTASHWQLAPCQWHVVDGCHRRHCQKRDNAASNAGQREMKEAQRRGQANYSDTQLRADGDRAHQQPVWVINTFCHRRSHLCSERLMARRRGPAILGFYAKWMIEKGLRG